MATVAIVYHSTYGHTEALAKSVKSGAERVGGISAILVPADGAARLRFVPAPNFAGTAEIMLRAWDQTGGTAGAAADTTTCGGITAFSVLTETARITVLEVNDSPQFSPIADLSIPDGVVWTRDISALDADGDPMTITAVTLPGWLVQSAAHTVHEVGPYPQSSVTVFPSSHSSDASWWPSPQ